MSRKKYSEGEFEDIFGNEDAFENLEDFLDDFESYEDDDSFENN